MRESVKVDIKKKILNQNVLVHNLFVVSFVFERSILTTFSLTFKLICLERTRNN